MPSSKQEIPLLSRSPECGDAWRALSEEARASLPAMDVFGVDSKNAWTTGAAGVHIPLHILLERRFGRPCLDPEAVAVEGWLADQVAKNPLDCLGAPCALRREGGDTLATHAVQTKSLVVIFWGDGSWRARPLESAEANRFDAKAEAQIKGLAEGWRGNGSYFASFARDDDGQGADDELVDFFEKMALILASESLNNLFGFSKIAPNLGGWAQQARERMAQREANALRKDLLGMELRRKKEMGALTAKKQRQIIRL